MSISDEKNIFEAINNNNFQCFFKMAVKYGIQIYLI